MVIFTLDRHNSKMRISLAGILLLVGAVCSANNYNVVKHDNILKVVG